MIQVWIFLLSGLASWLIFKPQRRWNSFAVRQQPKLFIRLSPQSGKSDDLPRQARQLAALMSAGRIGTGLWVALTEVLQQESQKALHPGSNFVATAESSTSEGVHGEHPSLAIVRAVQQATALGFPTAQAIRLACSQLPSRMEGARSSVLHGIGGRRHMNDQCRATVRMWFELAACFEVCERSGAPLAAVVSRLADRLDIESDTEALRVTALAGPKATVKLLTWLPFLGLGLGVVMGVDPLSVLLGGPLGWACLIVGLVLVVVGKWWAGRLLAMAASVNGGRPAKLRYAVKIFSMGGSSG